MKIFEFKVVVLVTLIALLSSGPALAEGAFWERIWTNADTREKRLQLASDIRNQLDIDKFLTAIPNLSPREKIWIKDELAGGKNRALKVRNSNEYSTQQARQIISTVDVILKRIVSSKTNEFRDWTILTYTLLDTNSWDYVGIVCERKIIEPCPLLPVDPRFIVQKLPNIFAKKITMGVLGPKFGAGFKK